ncbi:unnamed protein product [Ceratitis capitata]|uniref:(Mediterranean fruit fly) hypothetical protein n=1 Tax=Ceratitis capitata TaxID=7213 RepID=A0A811UI91_CERCA|nr:unnamed protein product [Ceratitis capitata]
MCTRIRNGVGRQMQPTAGVSAGEGKGKEKPRGKIGKTGPKKIAKTGKYAKIGIAVPPTNQTKLEGEKVIFSCEAKAMPGNVTVRWFREGSPVREVASLETRVTIRKDGSLIINPVSADDSGQYLCEVTNGIGDPQSASAYLNVECEYEATFICM